MKAWTALEQSQDVVNLVSDNGVEFQMTGAEAWELIKEASRYEESARNNSVLDIARYDGDEEVTVRFLMPFEVDTYPKLTGYVTFLI